MQKVLQQWWSGYAFSGGRCGGSVTIMQYSYSTYPCRDDVAPASPAVAAAKVPDAAAMEEGPTAQTLAEAVHHGYELSLAASD